MRKLIGGLIVGATLAFPAASAYAINDPRVPANECSPANWAAVAIH